MPRRLPCLLLLLVMLSGVSGWAQHPEPAVPAQLAVVVMLRVLSYDPGFAGRGGDDFVLLVAGKPGDASDKVLVDLASLPQTKLAGRQLRVERAGPDALEGAAVQHKAGAVLLVGSDSSGVVSAALKAGARANAYTLTLDEGALRQGVMLGVGTKDGRPQPLINPVALKAANVALPQSVLKVARLVQ